MCALEFLEMLAPVLWSFELHLIVHYDTSAMKRFLTSVSFQHEPKASDVITLVNKTFCSHEYRTKFYITRCENADFRTRSDIKIPFSIFFRFFTIEFDCIRDK